MMILIFEMVRLMDEVVGMWEMRFKNLVLDILS